MIISSKDTKIVINISDITYDNISFLSIMRRYQVGAHTKIDLKVNGVILRKLGLIEQLLRELRSLGLLTVGQLEEDWRNRRAVERSLQIAVEAMIDICQRLLTVHGQTPAATGQESVARCVEMGILSSQAPYRRMVQFRNFIVHRYEQVDASILVDIVNCRLDAFEQFVREVREYVSKS